MTSISFSPVQSDRDLATFADLPTRLFGNGPVPDLLGNLRAMLRGTHPTLQHGQCTLWLGRNPVGEVVARFSSHSDERIDTRLDTPTQLFGFLAYADDRSIADAIVAHLASTAATAQRKQLFGPAGLLPNQNGGVVTGDWDKPGFVDGPWNPEYLPSDLTRNGFTPQFAATTYISENLLEPTLDPAALFPFPAERVTEEQLIVRPLRRRAFRQDRERLRRLLNASFDQLGYFTPISESELRHQMEGVGFIADPKLFLFLERRGEPIAFMLALPDLSDTLRASRGRLGPGALLRAIRHARRTREALLVIKGTLPEVQGQGYMRLLSQHLLQNLRAGGYHTLRSTWVETSNPASAAQGAAMGGRPYQQVAFFSRPVTH